MEAYILLNHLAERDMDPTVLRDQAISALCRDYRQPLE